LLEVEAVKDIPPFRHYAVSWQDIYARKLKSSFLVTA
jgi:hypothetical protein